MTVRFLSWCAARGATLLATGIFLGLALPPLAALLRPALAYTVTLILAVTLARIDWDEMAEHAGRWAVALVALSWLLLLCPVAAWLAMVSLGPHLLLASARVILLIFGGTASLSFLNCSIR